MPNENVVSTDNFHQQQQESPVSPCHSVIICFYNNFIMILLRGWIPHEEDTAFNDVTKKCLPEKFVWISPTLHWEQNTIQSLFLYDVKLIWIQFSFSQTYCKTKCKESALLFTLFLWSSYLFLTTSFLSYLHQNVLIIDREQPTSSLLIAF